MNRTAVHLSAMVVCLCAGLSSRTVWSVDYPGPPPGTAAISLQGDRIEFSNQILSGSWGFASSRLQGTTVCDLQSGSSWESAGDLFRIVLADDTTYGSSSLKVTSPVTVEKLVSQPSGPRLADQFAGREVEVTMSSEDQRLRVVWRAMMLDESNYIRQELEVSAPKEPLTIQEVVWLDEAIPSAVSASSVDGSVVVVGPLFMGCEDPMAENRVVAPTEGAGQTNNVTRCRLARHTQLQPGEDVVQQSFVIGVAPQNQMRRAFLYYLERERAHPYRPYLHYNSWYDTAWQPFALNEENCLEAIKLFGERLIRRHGVVLDGMVFDDGWDNPHTLWQFHEGFPRGFTPLADLCRAYTTQLGVWLSPFGGYGEPRETRLAFGREQGFETNPTGFSLAGPKYYQAFRQACVGMIRNYGVNYFKFDGIAQGMSAQGAGEYIRDTEAMRRLMQELRLENPRLFINLTTGSWPSPFWLRYADSLWRQGGDMGLAGVGTKQQQWLTYRDQETYRNIVCRAPLYPLNSLMTQGVAYSRQGSAGEPSFNSEGFRDDVRAFFGSGTDLQELYIQPGKLTDADWSVLAEAAKWSRANADVLVDTHWIGGDPGKLEVYGFASWSPRKGIVMLRNPDERPDEFALDIGSAFELPGGAATTYTLHSPWAEDAGKPELTAAAGSPVRLELKPFEVVVLDATPRDAGVEEGFEKLFPQDGVPQGWVVRRWDDLQTPADPGVEWKVIDGVLHGSEPRGTWLVSEREYGDFVLKKVLLNGDVIQDVNLETFDQTVKRHDNSDAPPIKDRPRRGHIGFQELSRDGAHVQIRNARIKIVEKPPASSLEPAELRCEYRQSPVGIDAAQPRFQWLSRAVDPHRRGLRQTAYRVLVAAADVALQEERGDMWDSGKVAANQSVDIRYDGQALQPHAKYWWTVQLWDQDDKPTGWSQPASFCTGLPADRDWVAQWIAAPDSPSESALPIFRHRFALAKPVRHAVVFICGLGHYELHLNGQRVGDQVMDPGWTNYRRTCLYSGYDVTDRLQVGDNALGVMLGNGMYNVTGGRYVKFTGSFGPPKLICQLHVVFADGTTQVVASDPTWRTAPGPILFSCIYGGEDYDARRELPGWDTAAYDDAAWSAAAVCDGPGGRLVAQYAPPIHVAERLTPVAINRLGPGAYEVDCGLNLSARPFLKVRGPRGSQVTASCAEQKGHPWEGHSYTYTLKGDGEETFVPRFTYFSFQYLYLSGVERPEDAKPDAGLPVLLDVGSEFLTSSATDVGSFHSSSPLLNDIDAMIGRSVRSNLQCVLTDCPHREKLGWLEVSHLMGPSIFYHHDVHQLYRKICHDTSESQLDSGLVPDIAPEYTRFSAGFFESAEWGSAAVQLPWLLFHWYGDRDVLREQYDTMARYVRYLASTRNDHGLAKPGLGDWYDWTPDKGHSGYSQLTPLELTATAFLYDNARIVGQVADMLGKRADARELNDLAEQVRSDFLRAYADPAKGTVSTGSQAALAVALYFNLVPDDQRPQLLAALVRTIEENGYRQTTGEVCFRMLVQTLANAGRSDIVYRMLQRDDPPGYGYMLKLGFKTLSETWNGPGSSMNHCMFGHAREWFQKSMLGIQQEPGSVGFQKILFVPEPVGDVTSAAGHYDSAYGRIESAWRIEDGEFAWQVSVPPNTSAVLQIPAQRMEDVTESGTPVAQAAGVRVVGLQPPANRHTGFPRAILEVGSGQYRLRSTLPKTSS